MYICFIKRPEDIALVLIYISNIFGNVYTLISHSKTESESDISYVVCVSYVSQSLRSACI